LYLSQPLAQLAAAAIETKVGPAHGDLHPGNVLVVGTAPVIIDYGSSEENLPLGVDAARLFGGLVRGAFSTLPLHELTDLLSETLGLIPHRAGPDCPAARAHRLLEILSEEVGRISGPSHSALWPYHLYGLGWIGLKWSDGTTAQYRASFLLSAVAITKLWGRPKTPGPALDPSYKQQIRVLSAGKADAIKPEGPAEILVIVAEFNGHGDFDPTARIYGSLADHVHELIPRLARVERVATSVVSRKDAIELASQYKASMIVWGSYDSFGVSPRYDITRDSLVMMRALVQLDQATRHALGERFEPYVTHGLTDEITFLSLIAIGQMCTLNLNYDAAISVLKSAITMIPDPERAAKLGAAQGHAALSGIFLMTHREKEALAEVALARQLEPSNIIYELQELALQAAAGITPEVEALAKLRDVIIRQIPAAGDNADALRKVVEVLDSVKNPADLVEHLKSIPRSKTHRPAPRGFQQGNRDVIYHLQKASDLFHECQLRLALIELKKALRINPRAADALYRKAEVIAYLGDVDAARRDLKVAERIDPKISGIDALRGRMFWLSDRDAPEAVAAYERADELGYPKWPPDLDRVEALVALGRHEEVLGELKHGTIDPTAPELFAARSMCYQRSGDMPGALSEANQAILLWESGSHGNYLDASWLFVRRGEVRRAMGDHQGAIADLEHAVGLAGEFVLWQKNILVRLDAIQADAVSPGLDSVID
jgi:tetratricopeptide (TPR) repeat protein